MYHPGPLKPGEALLAPDQCTSWALSYLRENLWAPDQYTTWALSPGEPIRAISYLRENLWAPHQCTTRALSSHQVSVLVPDNK